jgi:uncharacterized membrane protein
MSEGMAVLIASYPTQQLAETDYKVLQDLVNEGALPLDDAAVVVKNADGKSAVVKDLHKPVRKGLIIGAALAALTPVGMVAGLVGGGLAGKLTSLFHDGLPQSALRDIGKFIEDNTVVVVVAGPPPAVEVVRDTLREATGFVGTELDDNGHVIREQAETAPDED